VEDGGYVEGELLAEPGRPLPGAATPVRAGRIPWLGVAAAGLLTAAVAVAAQLSSIAFVAAALAAAGGALAARAAATLPRK